MDEEYKKKVQELNKAAGNQSTRKEKVANRCNVDKTNFDKTKFDVNNSKQEETKNNEKANSSKL